MIEPDEENEGNLSEEEDAEIEATDLQLNRENQDEIQRESDEENAISTIAVRDTFWVFTLRNVSVVNLY